MFFSPQIICISCYFYYYMIKNYLNTDEMNIAAKIVKKYFQHNKTWTLTASLFSRCTVHFFRIFTDPGSSNSKVILH